MAVGSGSRWWADGELSMFSRSKCLEAFREYQMRLRFARGYSTAGAPLMASAVDSLALPLLSARRGL